MTDYCKAIIWIHDCVGENLNGEASLEDSINWIRNWGSDMDLHILEWYVLPILFPME